MSTINLLPQDYVQRRSQYRVNLICMVLFAVVMASVGAASLVSERTSKNTREVCERINAAYADAAKLIDEVHQLEARKRKMLQKARMSAALMERLPRSYVLAALTNALPKGAALISLEMSVRPIQPNTDPRKNPRTKYASVAQARARKQASPTPPTLAVVLDIKGKASTDVQVARFIANLARHGLMEMVDLSYSKEGEGKSRSNREFRLMARLKPNADALDALREGEGGALQAGKPEPKKSTGGGA
ncbi:MAG TPA: PilN domain-containing protein [Phycisphaerae bacterium]|nr:PilN domain-containing protein [Phycisphaerae bacterium]